MVLPQQLWGASRASLLVNVTFNLGEVDLKELGHLSPPYPPSTTFNNVLEGCNLLNEDTQWERLT